MTVAPHEPAAPIAAAASPGRVSAAVDWWQHINDSRKGDPGSLAELRRCRSTTEATRVVAAVDLARRLGSVRSDTPDWRTRAALDLSRVLAHVKAHTPGVAPMRAAGWKRFPGTRKESEAGDDRPRLAESRFKRLMQTGDGEEKVVAFVRLIRLLGGEIDVAQLADDFFMWNSPTSGDRVRRRWAFQYYAAADAIPRTSEHSDREEDDA